MQGSIRAQFRDGGDAPGQRFLQYTQDYMSLSLASAVLLSQTLALNTPQLHWLRRGWCGCFERWAAAHTSAAGPYPLVVATVRAFTDGGFRHLAVLCLCMPTIDKECTCTFFPGFGKKREQTPMQFVQRGA